MNRERFLQIIPGTLSWSILALFVFLSLCLPLYAALLLIVYFMYWGCKLMYMSVLLLIAHYRMQRKKQWDWLALANELKTDITVDDIHHIVIYPTYKEPIKILDESVHSLTEIAYPRERIIVVLAGEEREPHAEKKLEEIRAKYLAYFKDIVISMHPANMPGEIPSKGANATCAAKKMKEYVDEKRIPLDTIIVSCFDSDTCVDKNYFGCLTYHFMKHPKRHQVSYQPLPIYSNNIYTASPLARIAELGSTFELLVESMRHEKFITFSSHSMSFRTLIDVDYWPVDLVSDDSLIYWKCFLHFNGDYRTFPLEVAVYMDIAVGKNPWDTLKVQYKQKRRWAWGVENFIFISLGFANKPQIPLLTKLSKQFQILENHVNWATWAIIISFISPLILFWGNFIMKDSIVFFNLSYINNLVFRSLTFILLICILISWEFMPPRPKGVSRFIYLSFVFQWLLIPFVSAVLGSFPALDAQTQLLRGHYLGFTVTPKSRS